MADWNETDPQKNPLGPGNIFWDSIQKTWEKQRARIDKTIDGYVAGDITANAVIKTIGPLTKEPFVACYILGVMLRRIRPIPEDEA